MPFAPTVAAPATDLTHLPAREVAALVRVGRLSAQDAVAAYLLRHVGVDTRRATAQAVRLDVRLRHGLPGGALAGVPVLAPTDGPVTERLQAAGAVVLALPHAVDVTGCAADVATGHAALAVVPLGDDLTDRDLHGAAAAHGLVGLVAGTGRAGILARDGRDAALVVRAAGLAS